MSSRESSWVRIGRAVLAAVVAAVGSNRRSQKTSSGSQPRPRADSTSVFPGRTDTRSGQHGASAGDASPGQFGDTATVSVAPPSANGLALEYSPNSDGDPDAGEVVWTWVPYDENDGRGKDRPVLVIAHQSGERFYAVRLTSKQHDGDREYLSIGSGAWDLQGRESWVDIDSLYSVHADGMRREAAALDRETFVRVAKALHARHGWQPRAR